MSITTAISVGGLPPSASSEDRVRDTLTVLVQRAEELGDRLLGRLLVFVPDGEQVFRRFCRAQGRTPLRVLQLLHALRSDRTAFVRACAMLARHQTSLGVDEFHYDAFGAALLLVLHELLGDEYDEATENAWAEFYADIAETILAATVKAGAGTVSEGELPYDKATTAAWARAR